MWRRKKRKKDEYLMYLKNGKQHLFVLVTFQSTITRDKNFCQFCFWNKATSGEKR